MSILLELKNVLHQVTFLEDDEKKNLYQSSQNMPIELINLLVTALKSNSIADLKQLKKNVTEHEIQLKKYANKKIVQALRNFYKKLEELSKTETELKEEQLIQSLDQI